MNDPHDLQRFLEAQANNYQTALLEIRQGQKRSHWMWYIFPQLKGLGRNSTASYYAIKTEEEAREYLNHVILGPRLLEISKAFLDIDNRSARDILGGPDDLKMRSSMTLFDLIQPESGIFDAVLEKYYAGRRCRSTKNILNKI